jgi:hypothetical protein
MQMFYRMLFKKTRLNYKQVFSPMDTRTYAKYQAGIAPILDSKLFILQCPNAKIDRIATEIMAAYHKINPVAIFIDYMQIITREPRMSEYDCINHRLEVFRRIQQELDLPVVILTQMRKSKDEMRIKKIKIGERQVPLAWIYKDDIRGSGEIFERAQMVFAIQFPAERQEGQSEYDFILQSMKSQIIGGVGMWPYHVDFSIGEYRWLDEPINKPSGQDAAANDDTNEPF